MSDAVDISKRECGCGLSASVTEGARKRQIESGLELNIEVQNQMMDEATG
jgi:hypothetical protein